MLSLLDPRCFYVGDCRCQDLALLLTGKNCYYHRKCQKNEIRKTADIMIVNPSN